MTTLRNTLLAGLALTVGVTGLAVAQQTTSPSSSAPETTTAAPAAASGNEGAPTREERRAARRDRTVSDEDYGARRLERMQAADADGNGELSRTEIEEMALRQMVERRADRMERRLDIDGDGTVTLAEVEAHQDKRFAYLDRNEDGVLDRGEMRRGERDGKGGPDRGDRRHHRMDEPRGER